MGILDKLTGKDAREMEAAERQSTATQTPTLQELKDKENEKNYIQEQKELLEKRRLPTAQEKLIEVTTRAARNIRARNIQRQMDQQKPGKTLNREEVERIARRVQRTTPKGKMGGKMTSGQFHAPMFGPNIPSGGVGKKMNFDMGSALDFPGFGGTHGKKKSQGKKMSDWFKF